jgi:hypothetical protein
MSADTIQTNVQSVTVTGRIVERSAFTLEIELLRPFGRLRDGRSIMAAARPYVSYEGQYGDQAAAQLLVDLYRIAAYVEENLDNLTTRWAETKKQRDERCHVVLRSQAEYIGERAKSRRLLRDGLIRPDDHEGWMIELRHAFEEWSLLLAEAVDALLSESGLGISLDLQAQVMKRIDPSFDPDLPQETPD